MSVIIVVLDAGSREVVDLVRTEEPTIEPFGGRLFGPSPSGRPFPRAADIAELQKAIVLQSLHDSINTSPFLSDAKREELRGIYNTILPSDRILGVTVQEAQQAGLIPAPLADTPGPGRVIIQVFFDP